MHRLWVVLSQRDQLRQPPHRGSGPGAALQDGAGDGRRRHEPQRARPVDYGSVSPRGAVGVTTPDTRAAYLPYAPAPNPATPRPLAAIMEDLKRPIHESFLQSKT